MSHPPLPPQPRRPPRPTADSGSESAPLLSSLPPSFQSLMLRRRRNVADDDVASQNSRSSSIHTAKFIPWAFRDLSSNLIPSGTEVVMEGDDSSSSDDSIHRSNDRSRRSRHSSSRSRIKSKASSSSSSSSDESSSAAEDDKDSPLPHLSPTPRRTWATLHKKTHPTPHRVKRSLRRRIFLILTEPQTSIFSALFFILLISLIAISNILMMMQTMRYYEFTPSDCIQCGATKKAGFLDQVDDTVFRPLPEGVPCQCPPSPIPSMVALEDAIILFFTIEWSLRVVCYAPPIVEQKGGLGFLKQWISFLILPSTILDALAIFPYYLERIEQVNGLLSLRLLRLFRVFQLLRLGQYNVTFMTLTNVLTQSLLSLNILIIVLVFGAAFFGSIIYWLEKGEWKYSEYSDPPSFMYMRIGIDGVTEEPSPFTSIPAAFWWFIVTATTVGYGDVVPTSMAGKFVGIFAMLTGVLVIAFPVSVFSDLWSKELKKMGALTSLESVSVNGDFDDEDDDLLKEPLKDRPKLPRQRSSSREMSYRSTRLGFPDPIREIFRKEKEGEAAVKHGEDDDGDGDGNGFQRSSSFGGSRRSHRRSGSNEGIHLNTIESGGDSTVIGPKGAEVVLGHGDVDAIMRHLTNIEESQRQIRRILKGIGVGDGDGRNGF